MTTNHHPMGWSELVSDVLSLIYNRLSVLDFARAKTVCSSWYSVSRSSSPKKNNVPWLIFKQHRNWFLFHLEDDKLYRTQIDRLGLGNCRSLATSGNWALVTDNIAYMYIINLFTLEVIDLPPLKTHNTSDYKKLDDYLFHFDFGLRQEPPVRVENAVLWVDQSSKDYLVVWTSGNSDRLNFCRKGYEEWYLTPWCKSLGEEKCVDLAYNYKDKKLYILSYHGNIRIMDFSQEYPIIPPKNPYAKRQFKASSHYVRTRMKLTTSGDVLMIRRVSVPGKKIRFKVNKWNSTDERWKRVDPLEEEEALVWDLSDALPTKGVSGIKNNSIYLSDDSHKSVLKTSTFEIPTKGIERFGDLRGVSDARWFLPSFGVGE